MNDHIDRWRAETEELVAQDVSYQKARMQARLERAIAGALEGMSLAFKDLAAAVTAACQSVIRQMGKAEGIEVFDVGQIDTVQKPLREPKVNVTVSVQPADWVVAMRAEIAEICCTTPEHVIITVEGTHHLDIELDTANPIPRQELDAVVKFVETNKLTHVTYKIRAHLWGTADSPGCPDCGGSGWYVGLHERKPCPTCRGDE